GFIAVTVVVPRLTPAGTMNVAWFPVAVTTWAGTSSTVIWALPAPKPMPVIITGAPTLAYDGAMLSMRPAWAAKVGERSGPGRANAMATMSTNRREETLVALPTLMPLMFMRSHWADIVLILCSPLLGAASVLGQESGDGLTRPGRPRV